ncbi:MAG: SdpI family protein [Candidatus Nanohalobium sp.]
MDSQKKEYLVAAVFALMAGITVYGFLNIQGDIAVHFNASGQPNNTMSKFSGLMILPVISIAVYLLIMYLTSIDPLKENVENFRPSLKGLAIFITGFLTYIQGMIVFWNLGYSFNVSAAITPGIAVMFYAMGVLCDRAERNWFIGVRTPWTLSSDEVWRKTHRKAAPLFKLSGLIALGGLVFPQYLLAFVLIPVIAVSIYATVYSFKAYRDLEK